ncbi:hypothetical protein COCON_G00211780 [Conger conger]|uniref:Amine oxidase n=1 Tax=Conger conger TaxID=82655 RepID=A0A9Q1D0Z6_CONCO|nr:hypothetical protein COCON_G00211780 [Conger conger]
MVDAFRNVLLVLLSNGKVAVECRFDPDQVLPDEDLKGLIKVNDVTWSGCEGAGEEDLLSELSLDVSCFALKRKGDSSSLVFADLTADEYRQVRDYMWNQPALDIARDSHAKPSENFIFMIDLQLPRKADALRFLDKGAAKPERNARVVVFHGTLGQIKEYVVGPLPIPTYHTDVTRIKYKADVPLSSRTVTIGEYSLLFNFLGRELFGKLDKILKESFDIGTGKALLPYEAMPRGIRSSTGMRVFDIRFKGERIAYELSVQEAMSVYGSNTPGLILTKFLDASIGIGRFAHELARGVDCPYNAVYVDTVRYIDITEPKTFKNSICIFEHDTGRPLRRHFSDFFSNSYGGLANSVLVFRTITAIGNYDYIWDFIFYQSGSVEAKVHATGYISSSYKIHGSLKYGHQVAENTIGNIHTHFINFKVDLDVLGVKNMFQVKDMTFKEVELPWLPGQTAKVPHLVEKTLRTEKEAAQRNGEKIPRYLHIASNQTNRWGHQRSYRLQVISFTGEHLPEGVPEEKSMSWARYKVAITKHKDEEESSTSLHSQNGMLNPPVDFSTFIDDNENIMEQDLVAWVTTGFLHIPHAEDIPNTVTVGNGGGVILRPHNYFDQDPSVDSPDAAYIHPTSPEQCENNRMACLAQETCHQELPPFTYNAFDGVMVF